MGDVERKRCFRTLFYPSRRYIKIDGQPAHADAEKTEAFLYGSFSLDTERNEIQLLPADVLAPTTMKNAAKCDT